MKKNTFLRNVLYIFFVLFILVITNGTAWAEGKILLFNSSVNLLMPKLLMLQRGDTPGAPISPAEGLLRGGTLNNMEGKDAECQRRHADWERNLAPKSMFCGFILSFTCLCVLTAISLSSSAIRLLCSIVFGAILGPLALGLQKYELLKVCPMPPNFGAVLSADLFWWTLAGIGNMVGLIILIRYLTIIRNKFSSEQITP